MPETLSRKEYIKEQERNIDLINVGEPAIIGIAFKGHPERKPICEDVKINDPDNGLFLVADGVTRASGWFASRETARILNEGLGGELDDQIKRIAQNKNIDSKRKEKLIDALVRSEIRSSILEADNHIITRVKTDSKMRASATTVSVAKLVEMPDGEQSIFLSNIGDSRIFIMRKGKLSRLTKDDSLLTFAVSEKIMSEEQARQIDQANSLDEVPDRWKSYYRQRNQVMNSVGGHGLKEVEVHRFSLEKGDRIILASDGLTDQLKENEIEFALLEFENPREAERALQQRAEKMSLDGTLPRSKGDDIAVVVHEVGEHGPDRASRAIQKESEPEIFTLKQIDGWRSDAARLQQEIRTDREKATNIDTETKEGIDLLIKFKNKEQDISVLDYWIARAVVQETSKDIPVRFEKGQQVQVFRTDFEPPSYDRALWVVSLYDAKNDRYLLDHPSKKQHRFVERFTLELWQKGSLVRPDDVVDGYKVIGSETGGNLVLMKKKPDTLVRRVETELTVDKIVRDDMLKARAAKKEMTRSLERANALKGEIQFLTEKKVKLLAK
jgi:protein phosphatase